MFCSVKIYPPPELPRDYRPVHYFRPVVAATSENSRLLQVLSESAGKAEEDAGTHSRHQLNASKRGELLGETPVQGMCCGGDCNLCIQTDLPCHSQSGEWWLSHWGSVLPSCRIVCVVGGDVTVHTACAFKTHLAIFGLGWLCAEITALAFAWLFSGI